MKRQNVVAVLENPGDCCVLHHCNGLRRMTRTIVIESIRRIGARLNVEVLSVPLHCPCPEEPFSFWLPRPKSAARVVDYVSVGA